LRERPQFFLARSGPVAMGVGLRRVGPLRDEQDIPWKMAMRECGGIARNPAGGTAVIFENNKGKRGMQTVGMLDDCGDRIVGQFAL
jgi:hypothetical protein